MQTPEAGAGAVFVDRLHVHVTHAWPGRGPDDLGQERFGGALAMQDIVLAALLVIDDKLHGDTSALRPVGERRGSPVADHVARISSGVCHPAASPHSPECVSSQRYDRRGVRSSGLPKMERTSEIAACVWARG